MNITKDDPLLTAYALGEVTDEERAAVERFLNENPEARAEVEDIRAAATLLAGALAEEDAPALTPEQRAAVLAAAGPASVRAPARRGRLALRLALAAGLIVAVGAFLVLPALSRAREAAMRPQLARTAPNTDASKVSREEEAPAQPALVDQLAEPREFDNYSVWGEDFRSMYPPDAAQPAVGGKEQPEFAAQPAQENIRAEFTDKPGAFVELDEGSAAGEAPKGDTPAAAPLPQVEYATGSLQNVEIGGQLRIAGEPLPAPAAEPTKLNVRADFTDKVEMSGEGDGLGTVTDFYSSNEAKQRAGGQGGLGVPQVPAEVRDQLQALGYLSDKDGLDRRLYWAQPTPAPGSESYAPISENAFTRVADVPLSTFGVDVDTASYANVRRFLTQGTLPPPDAVRVEELVNYFRYEYPAPQTEHPFSVNVETHPCPWNPGHLLARIGLRGQDVAVEERAPVNLVFLVDVSGSMQPPEKLPLLVKGLKLLAESLTGRDRLSIVTYAGRAGVRLAPTPGDQKAAIHGVLDSLSAGGSTNGEGGIRIAYDLARAAFIPGGANRVMLATDGDFNVGVSDTDALVSMIQQQAKTGVFLTVLGFGTGNLQDNRMESLADKGNGQYFYIDSFQEARRALLEQAAGALVTIAKDVKIQVEFNPARVGHYRLIGYENRALAARDFNDDRKDAGEIGAGHTVTALYELVPPGVQPEPPQVDALKYQSVPEAPKPEAAPDGARPASNELMTVKLRYKRPEADTSTRLDVPVAGDTLDAAPGADHQFAAAVAAWGMLLRRSAHAGTASLDLVLQLAEAGKGADLDGRRAEFITLVRTTAALMGGAPAPITRE
ncbi:MAG: VWA domain-containing protein [Candidatus Hydrogenedentes bacterium]|nr:VWA domain-containing protein [Candidatus Hydrogenedentota bacterium]